MDLSIGGIVRQVVTPVIDAVSVARTGAVEQIASFLRDHPDQRGAVETTLASNGRAGDLSAIVERAGSALGQVAERATAAVPDSSAVVQTARTMGQAVGQAGADVCGSAAALLGRALPAASDVAARPAGVIPDAAARSTPAGEIVAARTGVEPGRTGVPGDVRLASGNTAPPLAGRADAMPTRGGDAIGAAIREGRLALLVGAAMREGQLAGLVADARTAGQVPALVAAARTLDGALAAFAGRGGLSATELALFARAGLLSQADTHALRTAGVPIDVEEAPPAQPAPRDGPAAERFDADRTTQDGVAIAGFADRALARFDAGAIRIASRSAVETYGVLGPPGGMVVAADAFEALLRANGGDLAAVEQRIGLAAGTLDDPDTLVAFVERRDLAGLRRAAAEALAAWAPGGEQAGGVPAALADLGGGVPFREMRFGGAAR